MKQLQRLAALAVPLLLALLNTGCTTSLVVAHLHDKLTEGDPVPCMRLNSVDRALQARCGEPLPGSLHPHDVLASGLPLCPLALAARDPQHWPLLAELIDKGASPERCIEPPLALLARADACPDFAAASPASLAALRWLAEADPRAIGHDTLRLLSCPSARAVGLDRVLDGWAAQGLLARGSLPFGALGALHPGHLRSPLARWLEAQGHQARDALAASGGQLAGGFELALRSGDLDALDWWFARVPELVQRVPATQAGQLPWLPLARVLTPSYLPDAALRERVVAHLLAHGADPAQRLPHDPGRSVLDHARTMRSPLLARLEDPAARPGSATALARAPAR